MLRKKQLMVIFGLTFVFLIILLLAIGLAACTRNLPAPEATETTEIESVSPTDDIGQTLAFNLTQTAMAQNPQLTPGAPGETPVVPDQPATDVTPSPVVAEPTATSPPTRTRTAEPPSPTATSPTSTSTAGPPARGPAPSNGRPVWT